MKEGWPLDSSTHDEHGNLNPCFIESDVEIGIGKNEEALYLGQPDLAIIVQGSDPYEKDQLPISGLLKLSQEQLLQRDMLVYHFLKERNIPQAYVMSGGYGEYSYEIYCQFLNEILT